MSDLTAVLGKMFGKEIVRADSRARQLSGGTLGDVRLFSGIAETVRGERLPYNIVRKTQKKWERFGDAGSWRREYDLYASDLGGFFSEGLCWPQCYRAELRDDEIEIWMEYAEGASGDALTVDMLERAAKELGRFQGRLSARAPAALADIGDSFWNGLKTSPKCAASGAFGRSLKPSFNQNRYANLSSLDFMRADYSQWKPETAEYRFIRSADCPIPGHLREMLADMDDSAGSIFKNIEKLPVVLCHRDFRLENIIYSNGKIFLIDWDTAGWGYLGEDIASLVIDDTNPQHQLEYFRRLIPAYYEGVSEYMDVSAISDHLIWEMILIKEGYRSVHKYIFNDKNSAVKTLQNIYDMKSISGRMS